MISVELETTAAAPPQCRTITCAKTALHTFPAGETRTLTGDVEMSLDNA
jgi:hypothetical protein